MGKAWEKAKWEMVEYGKGRMGKGERGKGDMEKEDWERREGKTLLVYRYVVAEINRRDIVYVLDDQIMDM
jgi:hypothetical protein